MDTGAFEPRHMYQGTTEISVAPEVSGQTAELPRWRVGFVKLAFVMFFLLLSPLYYLNRWDFVRKRKSNPFYSSKLVRLLTGYPILYELVNFIENFPAWHHVYDVLPNLAGDVLQVGCGTGLLNRHLRQQADIRFTNLDANLNALRTGVRLKRFLNFVHASIDRPTPLSSESFDVVLFARSFHHVRNHKRALMECARLLRNGGQVIITDPVILHRGAEGAPPDGYMANSSIDGLIWRFTRDTFVTHLEKSRPPSLAIESIACRRPLHISNYNLFVPQADIVVILSKRSQHGAG